MLDKKAFTLVELLVVVFIVAILAAVAVPIMRSRSDSAKWSEGRALAGTIANALRIYYAEKGGAGPFGVDTPDLNTLGLRVDDLKGAYFDRASYSWQTGYDVVNGFVFTISIAKPTSIGAPDRLILDQAGNWTEEND